MQQARPQRATAFLGAIAALAGTICVAALLAADVEGGAPAVLAGGLWMFAACVAAVVAWCRARAAERLLAGRSVLARWTYEPAEAAAYLDGLLVQERRACRRLFRVAGVLVAAAGILSVTLDPRGGSPAHLAFLVLLIALVAATEGVPRLLRAQRRRATPEAVVSSEVAYVAGALTSWAPSGRRLRDAAIVPGEIPVLRITYSASAWLGGGETSVSVPVPPCAVAAAVGAARALRDRRDRERAYRPESI